VDIRLLAVAGLLAGCTAAAPVVKTEGQETKVPVAVKCIDKKDLPAEPVFPLDVVDLSKEDEALPRLANAARGERKLRKEYIEQTRKALEKCAE
jgi:hypothetical protein